MRIRVKIALQAFFKVEPACSMSTTRCYISQYTVRALCMTSSNSIFHRTIFMLKHKEPKKAQGFAKSRFRSH